MKNDKKSAYVENLNRLQENIPSLTPFLGHLGRLPEKLTHTLAGFEPSKGGDQDLSTTGEQLARHILRQHGDVLRQIVAQGKGDLDHDAEKMYGRIQKKGRVTFDKVRRGCDKQTLETVLPVLQELIKAGKVRAYEDKTYEAIPPEEWGLNKSEPPEWVTNYGRKRDDVGKQT